MDLNKYTTDVTDFTRKFVEVCIPNQKPWMNQNILNVHVGTPESYKKSRHNLQKAITNAKKHLSVNLSLR